MSKLTKERENRLKRNKRKKVVNGFLWAFIVILTIVNIGFGLLNIKPLVQNLLDETEGTVAEETESITDSKDTKKKKSVSEKKKEASAIEMDARYAVVKNYKNLGIVTGDAAFTNIRRKPSKDSLSIGKAMRYTAFEIIGKKGKFYKIRSNKNEGYIVKKAVKTGESAKILAMGICEKKAYAKKKNTAITKMPEEDSEKLFTLVQKVGYDVVDVIGDWVQIHVTDGLEGYVKAKDVEIKYTLSSPIFYSNGKKLSKIRYDIVNYAFEWYGGQYVWGGTTLGEGVDCSGFTLRVFEHYGINLPRLSVEQSEVGEKIKNIDQALPGDLLFFHGYHDGQVSDGVGHVGIYIGNGKMIHAASELRGIVVDDVDYVEKPMVIRRVIKD